MSDLNAYIGGTTWPPKKTEAELKKDTGEFILKANGMKEKKPIVLWPYAVIVAIVALSLLRGCTAHAQELEASWYSVQSLKDEGTWGYSHGQMANGQYFTDSGRTAACWDFPLNTMVRVTNITNGKSVSVKVVDRTARRFKGKRIDLSISAFSQIADLKQGLAKVIVERIR